MRLLPWTGWPPRLQRDLGGVRTSISDVLTDAPYETDLLTGQHVLLGTLDGGAQRVEVDVEGAASWCGPKLPGAAGFFPGGRRMRSRWPNTRLTYLKLAIEPGATDDLLHRNTSDAAWQVRSSAEDPFISAGIGRLAAALEAGPDNRLARLTAETVATALHLHVTERFSGLGAATNLPEQQESLGRVLDLIHAALPQAASLAEMVEASGLPRARFLASFARRTGYSPHQYILRERMARARHLLETTRLPVGQVAVVIGCANAGHLTRLYQKAYGNTPLAWRQRHGRT